ncbi:tetratricopeptide repeat protein [bacterium]|nr:tetratricopeptide repeat protein [bacterium]
MEKTRTDVQTESPCKGCGATLDISREPWLVCESCVARHHVSCWEKAGRCGACGSELSLGPLDPLGDAPVLVVRPLPTFLPPRPSRKKHGRKRVRLALLLGALVAVPALVLAPRSPDPVGGSFTGGLPRVEKELAAVPEASEPVVVYDVRPSKIDNAEVVLETGATIDWWSRGVEHAVRGEFAPAISDWTRAVEVDPHDWHAWNSRGYVRGLTKDYEAAIADCTRAIELASGSDCPWNNRAYARFRRGDLDGAASDVDRALTLDPRNPYAYETRAHVRLARGNLDGAAADLERAVELQPERRRFLDIPDDRFGPLSEQLETLALHRRFR